MSDQKKKAYGLPTLDKRKASGLPVDISSNDTFLGLITKATEWKKGGGIQLVITLFNPDGTKVAHQNGNDQDVEIGAPMPLDGPKNLAYTRAIFAEADQFTVDAGYDLEDLLERWVYVKLERDKKRDENEQELAQWGPRLNVAMMTAIPAGERAMIAKMHERIFNKPLKVLEAGGGTAQTPAAPAKTQAAPAKTQAAPAKQAAPVAAQAGIDPNDPFGVGAQ